MSRRTLIVLTVIIGLGLTDAANSQGPADSTGKKPELVKYPIPGSEDAVGEVAAKADRAVLDDFYRSKVLAYEDQAANTNNAELFAHLMADRAVNSDERFRTGFALTKSAFVDMFRTGGHHFTKLQHDHVHLIPFGPSTVVVTAHSTSLLHFGGRVSPGPRLLTEVWIKLDGRWQDVVHAMSDLEGGMEPRAGW